jgi:hypothetical protein
MQRGIVVACDPCGMVGGAGYCMCVLLMMCGVFTECSSVGVVLCVVCSIGYCVVGNAL